MMTKRIKRTLAAALAAITMATAMASTASAVAVEIPWSNTYVSTGKFKQIATGGDSGASFSASTVTVNLSSVSRLLYSRVKFCTNSGTTITEVYDFSVRGQNASLGKATTCSKTLKPNKVYHDSIVYNGTVQQSGEYGSFTGVHFVDYNTK